MMKWMLAAGAAALAIASPALADKGGHGGKGQAGQSAKSDHGGGQKQLRSNRGGGQKQQKQAVSKRGGDKELRTSRGGGGNREVRSNKANRGDDKGQARQMRMARDDNRDRGLKIEVTRVKNDGKRVADLGDDRVFRVRNVDRGLVRVRDVDRDELFVRRLGYGVGGCPPGLDRKNNGCMPPGQAAKFIGRPVVVAARFGALEPLPRSFRNLYWDDDDYYYRYGGGYLYRVDRDDQLIASMIPLFGAALIGRPLSANYINPYNQPSYFNAFYPNSPYDCYQNGYGYVYETDCMTGLVEDVIPTYGYGYGVGQLMPASYSYYNVPYAYRPYFADNDDYYYRYAPGAIYRVDRGTALISAVSALLTGGLSVGQQLPAGYSAYNVPLAYRSTYFDTPNVWYRYDNGYIYGIDPRTRMVSNVAYAIV